jgi:hypothetical protein
MTMPDRRHRRAAALLGVLAALVVPALVAGHPLGNFTINHYAGVRVEPERILLDVVIDQAEIPTFQARLDFDTDADGEVSDGEADAGRESACEALAPSLALALDGRPLTPTLVEAGLTFPQGAGGLPTMRLVCGFAAQVGAPLTAGARLTFADTSFEDRLGWREIVVDGSGVAVTGANGDVRSESASARLTAYPVDVLTRALDDTAVSIVVAPGGPTLAPLDIADATPLPRSGDVAAASAPPAAPTAATPGAAGDAAPAPITPAAVSAASVAGTFRRSSGPPTCLPSCCSCRS